MTWFPDCLPAWDAERNYRTVTAEGGYEAAVYDVETSPSPGVGRHRRQTTRV